MIPMPDFSIRPKRTRALASRAAGLALLAVSLSAAVPAVVLSKRGPPSNRIDVVYISDGYVSADLPSFAATVNRSIKYRDTAFMAEPYRRYRNFFNFYRIDLPSPESGIDEPAKGIYRNTALDGSGNDRLGTVNVTKTQAAVADGMSSLGITADWTYVVLGTPLYYNSGGPVCVFSYPNYGEIALHEGGHSFHHLADEYTSPGTYAGTEPAELNATIDRNAPKWATWIGFNQPGVGLNGVYEGSRYFEKGIFRPSPNSKMNMTGQTSPQPFNKPAMERIVQDIYAKVKPLDGWLANQYTLPDSQSLWVKVVDPQVLLVDWWVDGKLLRRNGGQNFRPSDFPLAAGYHQVTANVYDEVVINANSQNSNPLPLDWVRSGLDKLQTAITWTVETKTARLFKVAAGAEPGVPLADPSGDLIFDLPREGRYRLSILRADGTLLDMLQGSGKLGRNAVPWRSGKSRPAGPLFLRLDAKGP